MGCGDLIIIYPKPYSIYSRGTISLIVRDGIGFLKQCSYGIRSRSRIQVSDTALPSKRSACDCASELVRLPSRGVQQCGFWDVSLGCRSLLWNAAILVAFLGRYSPTITKIHVSPIQTQW